MDMVTEIPAIKELVIALDHATLMAKQLPNTTDPSHIIQIYSTLHSAHHHLSSFLSRATRQPHRPPPQPSLPLSAAAENSVSAAVGGDEPMLIGDDDEVAMERVEERMRDCFIKHKRAKRSLSATAATAEEVERRLREDFEEVGKGSVVGFDPHATKLRSLDLIQQFHA